MKEFIENLCAEILEETSTDEINSETLIDEIDEWDSMCVMLFIGLADNYYKKAITGEDIAKCLSVNDLYKLVS